jgi:hypothetical protein
MPLEVALGTRAGGETLPGTLAVHVSVGGGTPPLCLMLFLDGEPVGSWESVGDIYEFRASDLPGARHSLTVRAVDSAGRWGGATTFASVTGPEPALVAADERAPARRPRFALRSSVRTARSD